MSEDLISRRGAIDALEKEKPTPFVNEDGSMDPFGVGRQNQWYRDGIAIMNLPSAQPERKRGRWIVYYECPKCGEITKDFTEYCPFCNADMRGEEDE